MNPMRLKQSTLAISLNRTMKSAGALAALLLFSGISGSLADTIELNGITCLFGDKMAVLVLHEPSQAKPVSFALSEGESRFGIKVLAVDAANHVVKIEQSGVEQSLRLCATPVLAMPDAPKAAADEAKLPRPLSPEEQSQIDQFLQQDQDAQRIKAGKPVVNVLPVGTPPASPGSSGAAGNSAVGLSDGGSLAGSSSVNSGTGAPGTSGTSGSTDSLAGNASTGSGSAASSGENYTLEYWYRTSLVIEQNRLATAAEVSSGDMEALPRTPLTPPQTPPALIGPDTFFSSRIPGFVDQSTVDD